MKNKTVVSQKRKQKQSYFKKRWIQQGLIGAASFGLITYDVLASNSFHMLYGLDVGIHNLVLSHVPKGGVVKYLAIILSNGPILVSCFGWACAVISISVENFRRGVILSVWLFFVFMFGGAYFQQGDPLSVTILKSLFGRPRPSSALNNFSFPSEHSTSATFVSGVFVFVLLPLALKYGSKPAKLQNLSLIQLIEKNSVYIPTICWGVTSCGRILADAHWFSDTLAGLSFGWTLVSIVLLLYDENIIQQKQ